MRFTAHILLLAACPAFAGDDSKATLHIGQMVLMGNGTLRSFAEVSADKKPLRIGVTFNDLATENLPFVPYDQIGKTFEVLVPEIVRDLPFNHVSIDYNSVGHRPQPIYGVPHFDVHFYTVRQSDRAKMVIKSPADKKVFSKPVPAGFMGPDYILAPDTEIPNMGAHWVDASTPELHGKPFTATLIYGSYAGKVIFIEPMIERKFLESKPSFTQAVKLPQKVTKSGYYPKEWSLTYDAARHEYTVAYSKFVHMKAAKG